MNKLRTWALALLALVGSAVSQAQVTVTDVVGVEDYITAAITTLGTIVGVAVGGYFAFKLAKIALRWAGRIGG